jgi:translation initiation factor 2A
MPARTVLFDVKANPVHSFGSLPRNFLSYQPQGRLFISAGFGNLTGTVDIHDLRTRKLVCQFQAPNSTTCEWSPCGRYILTGTLSPRLRVDNGIKVWWCSGGLMHAQNIDELYQVSSLHQGAIPHSATDTSTIYFICADRMATWSRVCLPSIPAGDP